MARFVVSLYLWRESGRARELNPVWGGKEGCWESGFIGVAARLDSGVGSVEAPRGTCPTLVPLFS